MGNSISALVTFELVKEMQKEGATMIHTMDESEKVLIVGTVVAEKEIEKINNIETLKKIYIESFDILKHNHDMYMDLKNKSFLSKILVQIAND